MQTDGMTEEQKAYVEGLEAALQARSAEVKELKHLLAVVIQRAAKAREAGIALMRSTVAMDTLVHLFEVQQAEVSQAAQGLFESYDDDMEGMEEDESDIYSEEE